MLVAEANAVNLAQTPLIAVLAVVGVAMVGATWVLWRRAGGRRPKAAAACGIASVLLHVLIFWLVPEKSQHGIGQGEAPGNVGGDAPVMVSLSDPEQFDPDQAASEDLTPESFMPLLEVEPPVPQTLEEADPMPTAEAVVEQLMPTTPPSLLESFPHADPTPQSEILAGEEIDQLLSEMLLPELPQAAPEKTEFPSPPGPSAVASATPQPVPAQSSRVPKAPMRMASSAVVATPSDDFANRRGPSLRNALIATGGDEQTEAAVAAALQRLASRQLPDGTWDPISTGAGNERRTLGHDRGGAGQKAVTGITGLALLAFMGHGYNHLNGPYQDNVARGLQALLNRQGSDGSMGGASGTYARMYCHSIATLALSEAYALTRDPRLANGAANALSYSARIQHPTTGGWRYHPGDPGDMSQFGWQAMAMQSGRQGGMSVDARIDQRMRNFLSTVRAGRGGLASYRPRLAPSRTMTAEALASRLLLGHDVPASEVGEAEAYLLQEIPGRGEDNFYYWYYASLALHQLQSPAWRIWNDAMKRRLIATQRPDGSWPTSTVWGGYGGEIYTTAMGALCLEVYYRHLTLHQTPAKIAHTPGTIHR